MTVPRRSLNRLLPASATGLVAALVLSVPAFAGTYAATPMTQSPDHPYAPGCAPTDVQGGTNHVGAEVEPYVDADLSSGGRYVVSSVQQDRWSNGGSHALTVAISNDFGASFHLAAQQPAFSVCSGGNAGNGGNYERATDPWVSFSPDGSVYAISDSFDNSVSSPGVFGPSAILVSKSTDKGNTWSSPSTLRFDSSENVLNDKESITADPNTASNVYATWDRLVSPSDQAAARAGLRTFAYRGPSWFARTTNAGASWEPARVIFDPGEYNQTLGNQIVVQPASAGGTLVDGFDLLFNKGGKSTNASTLFTVAVLRSTDQGASWSGPIHVDDLVFAPVSIAGTRVRTGDLIPEFAVDRSNGNMYATWQDGRFDPSGQAAVAFSMSTDGGLTWTPTVRISQTPLGVPAFTPQVHVANDGTIGVSYYDFRNGPAAGLTDAWLIHCHPSQSDCSQQGSWAPASETRLTPAPFDMTTAPRAGGYFTGDYEGLTSHGSSGFQPFYVVAQPLATSGQTDPESQFVCPSPGSC